MRIFNTSGPVRCAEHYCLPPLERFDLDEIMFLIEQKKYFRHYMDLIAENAKSGKLTANRINLEVLQ